MSDAERVKVLEGLLRDVERELTHAAFVAYLPEDADAIKALRDRVRAALAEGERR